MKRFLAIILSVLLMLSLAACGAKSDGGYAAEDNGMWVAEPEMPAPEADGYWESAESAMPAEEQKGVDSALPKDTKMIYRANIYLETLEFDKAAADIAALVDQLGGYFEQNSVSNRSSNYRYANYVVRIPAEQFRPFCHQLGTLCHMTYSEESAENITEQYYDTDSRLKTAQTKLKRLQELLSQADTMSDIITIESAISDTQYEIDCLSGTLRHYDALVGYATVNVSLNEVYKLSGTEDAPMTFGGRLGNAFTEGIRATGEFFEDALVWLAYHWLGLLILAAVIVLVHRLRVRSGKKFHWPRRKKKESTGENTNE